MAVSNYGASKVQNFAQSFAESYSSGMQQNNQAKQNAQQNKERDQQMQMIQDQNARAAKKQFKQDWNEALLEGDVYGDWNATQQFMQANADTFGGQVLRGVSNSDIGISGTGPEALSPTLRANYKNDTGYSLPDDRDEALAVLRKGAMLQKKDGSTRYVAPNSLSAGLSNYSSYKNKYMRTMNKDSGGQSDQDYAIDVGMKAQSTGGYRNLDPKDKTEFVVRAQKGGVLKNFAQREIGMGAFEAERTNIVNEWNPLMNSQDSLNDAYILENMAENKFDKSQVKARNDGANTIKSFNRLGNLLGELDNDATSQGEVQQFMSSLAARSNKEQWAAMSQSERQKLINNVKLQTYTGAISAKIVQMISGAAVSDSEFDRWQGILFGGGSKFVNTDVLKTSIATYSDELYQNEKKYIQDIGIAYPYSQMSLANNLENAHTGTVEEPKGTDLPDGTKDIAQTGRDVQADISAQIGTEVKEQGKQIIETGSEWFKEGLDSVFGTSYSDSLGTEALGEMGEFAKSKGITKKSQITPELKTEFHAYRQQQRNAKHGKIVAKFDTMNPDEVFKLMKDPSTLTPSEQAYLNTNKRSLTLKTYKRWQANKADETNNQGAE